jgi:kelch-like protein 20
MERFANGWAVCVVVVCAACIGGLGQTALAQVTEVGVTYTPDAGIWRSGATAGDQVFFSHGVPAVYDIPGDAWSSLSLPHYRGEDVSVVSLDDRVFFAGGRNGSTDSDAVDIYDVADGTWESATLSSARGHVATARVGETVIFAGGWSWPGAYSNAVDIYDSSTDSWSHTALPTTSGAGVGVAAGGKAFFVDRNATGKVDIYEPRTGTWTTAQLSQPRQLPACTAVGTKVFFAGGYTYSGNRSGSDVVDIYDTATDTWSTATLSEGRWSLTATALGRYALFAGGAVDRGYSPTLCSDVVDVYDTLTGQMFQAEPLSVARCQLAAASTGQTAFFAGGDRESGSASYRNVDMYVPEPATLSLLALGALACLQRPRRARRA